MKKILIILGHPDTEDTFTGALARAYEEAAREAGHEVTRVNLGALSFDPILHKGYKVIQQLEPDLVQLQEQWRAADHTVIIYPNWWNTMPALLKGMFDRMWLPGFAFNFDKEKRRVIQHLKGKTARVIIAAGTHSPFETWWKFGDYVNEIQHGILEFAGIRTQVSAYGPCDRADGVCREKWIAEVRALGHKAK